MTLMEALVTGGLFGENSDIAHKGFPGGQNVPMTKSSKDLAAKSTGKPGGRPVPAQNPLIQYGIALVAVAVAWLARILLVPVAGPEAPYLLFVPAVLVAAALGGLGPGLLATTLATVLGLLVSMGGASLSTAEILNAIIFALIGAGIAWGGEQLWRSRSQASTSTADALAREAHLKAVRR